MSIYTAKNCEASVLSVFNISTKNVNTFKNILDRLRANRELIFDYKGTLTGTSNIGVVLMQFRY